MSSNLLILIGRIFLSVLFILSGFTKLTGLAGTAQFFAAVGLPAPMALAVIVGLVELLGGLAILVGFQTRAVALVLAVFTLAATGVAHLDFADQMQLLMAQKNLAIAGGFLVLAALGAGSYALDAKRA
jgi:putative oxidoreductase